MSLSAAHDDPDRRTRGLRASFGRFVATFVKEMIQLRRDRLTFATMIMIPLFQLMLFGYAINTNPKNLPTAVLVQDDSAFTRSFLSAMRHSAATAAVASPLPTSAASTQ